MGRPLGASRLHSRAESRPKKRCGYAPAATLPHKYFTENMDCQEWSAGQELDEPQEEEQVSSAVMAIQHGRDQQSGTFPLGSTVFALVFFQPKQYRCSTTDPRALQMLGSTTSTWSTIFAPSPPSFTPLSSSHPESFLLHLVSSGILTQEGFTVEERGRGIPWGRCFWASA